MKHKSAIVFVILGLLALTNWSRTMAQSWQDQMPTPVGVWDVRGLDDQDVKWIATLVLTQDADKHLTVPGAWGAKRIEVR